MAVAVAKRCLRAVVEGRPDLAKLVKPSVEPSMFHTDYKYSLPGSRWHWHLEHSVRSRLKWCAAVHQHSPCPIQTPLSSIVYLGVHESEWYSTPMTGVALMPSHTSRLIKACAGEVAGAAETAPSRARPTGRRKLMVITGKLEEREVRESELSDER